MNQPNRRPFSNLHCDIKRGSDVFNVRNMMHPFQSIRTCGPRALKNGCSDTQTYKLGSTYRCFLPHCPCESTSPQDATVIDVEPSAVVNAQDPEAETLVYQCSWDTHHSPCGMFIEGTPRDILSHLRQRHGIVQNAEEPLECRWSSCSMDKPLKMCSIARHIARHLDIQFRCSRCELTARDDVVRDHIRRSPGCADAAVQLVPGSGARRIVSV